MHPPKQALSPVCLSAAGEMPSPSAKVWERQLSFQCSESLSSMMSNDKHKFPTRFKLRYEPLKCSHIHWLLSTTRLPKYLLKMYSTDTPTKLNIIESLSQLKVRTPSVQ